MLSFYCISQNVFQSNNNQIKVIKVLNRLENGVLLVTISNCRHFSQKHALKIMSMNWVFPSTLIFGFLSEILS